MNNDNFVAFIVPGSHLFPDFANASPEFNLFVSLFCSNPMKPLL